MIYRPMSGRRIWEELYKDKDNIDLIGMSRIEPSLYKEIRKMAEETAYDNFWDLRTSMS